MVIILISSVVDSDNNVQFFNGYNSLDEWFSTEHEGEECSDDDTEDMWVRWDLDGDVSYSYCGCEGKTLVREFDMNELG